MAHLVIPGELDVMGASLFGVPAIQIGFNKNLSWTHTVSKSARFVLYALQLAPKDPLKYKLGDKYVKMQHNKIEIEVKQPDGSFKTIEKDYYVTHFGPIVSDPGKGMGWDNNQAYALADSNQKNVWMTEQWLAINKSQSIGEMKSVIADIQGIPWVNTIAMARDGNVFYGDTARVPRLNNQMLKNCLASPQAEAIFKQTGMAILKSTDTDCDISSNGKITIFSLDEAPTITGTDHVANSNNSHWAPHLNRRLEGYSNLFGSEKSALTLRSRLGLLMLNELLEKREDINLDGLQSVLLNNRHFSSELLLKDLLSFCSLNNKDTELTQPCKVLSKWNGKADSNSVGTHLFREIIMTLEDEVGETKYFDVPFNEKDPLNTPHGLTKDNELVLTAVKKAIKFLRDKGIPLDAPLSDIQFVRRGDKKIPIHGGLGQVGVFNVIDGPVHPKEGYEVTHGSSFIMLVSMDNAGPVAKGVLTYSQATDETSPYYQDQTNLYAEKKMYYFPFKNEDINKHTVESYSITVD